MSDIIEEFLAEFLEDGRSMAQDSEEDGFVTLKDKEGNPYKANLNESEKQRYAETKKPLSKVKKEQKEEKTDKEFEDYIKQLKSVASHPTRGGLFGGRIKYYKNILKDIEDQGLKSMAEVKELLKSKYPGFMQVKQPEGVKPENQKEDIKKESKDKFVNYLTEKGLSVWEHPRTGEKRIYLNKVAQELLDIEVERYKTGSLKYFSMKGEEETNSYGNEVIDAIEKAYYDVDNKKIVLSSNNRASKAVGEMLKEEMDKISK